MQSGRVKEKTQPTGHDHVERTKKKQPAVRRVRREAKKIATTSFKFGFHSLKAIPYLTAELNIGIDDSSYDEKTFLQLCRYCDILDIMPEEVNIHSLSGALMMLAREIGCQFAIDKDSDKSESFLAFYRECDIGSDFIHVSVKTQFEKLQNYNSDWVEPLKALYSCLVQQGKLSFYSDDEYWIWERISEMAEPEYWDGANEEEEYWIDYEATMQDYTSGETGALIDSVKNGPAISVPELIEWLESCRDISFKRSAVTLAKLCLENKTYSSYDYYPHRIMFEDDHPVQLWQQVCLVADEGDLYYNEIQESINTEYSESGQEVPHTFFKIDPFSKVKITKEEITEVIIDRFPEKFYNCLADIVCSINDLDHELWKTLK